MNVNPNTRSTLSPPLSHSQRFLNILRYHAFGAVPAQDIKKNTESERGGERELSVYLDSHSSPLICNRTHMWCPSGMYLWAAPLTVLLSFIGRGTNVQVRG